MQQAKNYDLKHRGTVLSVSDKVIQFNGHVGQRKRDKLSHKWMRSYTIMGVHENGNYTVTNAKRNVRAARVYVS